MTPSVPGSLRIGLVCPYSFDVPGGVQAHVHDLAETLMGLGHHVSVLAPAENDDKLPPYAVSVGKGVSLPYNGSVARIVFGPVTLARVRRWLKNGNFDVLHLHEPLAPSISMLACVLAQGPIVATFHIASDRSRAVAIAHAALQPIYEKITGRIAVSALARRFQVEHLDSGGVEIPNGVDVSRFAHAEPLPGWPGEGGSIGFLGRFTEPRKGFTVLLTAFDQLVEKRPDLRMLVAGPGDSSDALHGVPQRLRDRIVMLGMVSDADKARMLRSVDIYVAPNVGGESFGIVLTEAMAAGAAIVASDLDAFRRVLADGRAGALFSTGDPDALAALLASLLDDSVRRHELKEQASSVVQAFDWPVIARRVLDVYASAIDASPVSVIEDEAASTRMPGELNKLAKQLWKST